MKIQEVIKKRVAIAEEKGKQYVRQIIYTNQGYLPTKVTPAIDFTDKPVIQCNVLVVKNTFEMIVSKWQKWQTIDKNYCT